MLEQLVARAAALTETRRRAILGITGCPGAGKSTLARHLVDALVGAGVPAVGVPMDGFHLADAALGRLGRQARKGAVDTFDGYGYLAMLARFGNELDHPVYAPDFDRTLEQPVAGSIAVTPETRLVVTEGNYLLSGERPWPQVRGRIDEVWFVDLDDDLRRERLVARHTEFGKSPADARQWVSAVDEVNAAGVMATRDLADLCVDLSAAGPVVTSGPAPQPMSGA